jgi:hypothetical protein
MTAIDWILLGATVFFGFLALTAWRDAAEAEKRERDAVARLDAFVKPVPTQPVRRGAAK